MSCLSRLAPSVTRVVICVSRAFCWTDQEKRETARSLTCFFMFRGHLLLVAVLYCCSTKVCIITITFNLWCSVSWFSSIRSLVVYGSPNHSSFDYSLNNFLIPLPEGIADSPGRLPSWLLEISIFTWMMIRIGMLEGFWIFWNLII